MQSDARLPHPAVAGICMHARQRISGQQRSNAAALSASQTNLQWLVVPFNLLFRHEPRQLVFAMLLAHVVANVIRALLSRYAQVLADVLLCPIHLDSGLEQLNQ
mgnify:CR=1 FL=1